MRWGMFFVPDRKPGFGRVGRPSQSKQLLYHNLSFAKVFGPTSKNLVLGGPGWLPNANMFVLRILVSCTFHRSEIWFRGIRAAGERTSEA